MTNEKFYIEQASKFVRLDNKFNFFKLSNLLKISVIPLILVLFCLFTASDYNINFTLKKLKNFNVNEFQIVFIAIFSIIFYISFVFLLKQRIIYTIDKCYKGKVWKTKSFKKRWGILVLIFSPDYISSQVCKSILVDKASLEDLEDGYRPVYYEVRKDKKKMDNLKWFKHQLERKFLIEWSNWMNVLVSCLLLCGIVLLYIINGHPYLWIITITFISYRIISRSTEICIAFYKDVVRVDAKIFCTRCNNDCVCLNDDLADKLPGTIKYINGFKSSLIRPQGRLSLAIHSLIEMFILFGSFYYFMAFFEFGFFIDSTLNIFTPLLYSLTLGVFNVSFDVEFQMIRGIVHALQVSLSCILILLSVAQYLNGEVKINEESDNYYFYKAVKIVEFKGNKVDDQFGYKLIGNYNVYFPNDIIWSKENNTHKFKYNKQVCVIKYFNGKLEIEHCERISMNFVGTQELYLYKTYL